MDYYRRIRITAILVSLLCTVAVTLPAEPVQAILEKADTQLGTPYRSGGISPGGFDCSGFVSWLYRPTLPNLPRISRDQARSGEVVANGDWQQGDLLFYATGSDPNRINHVAIWYGGGQIIHSISDGPETGVVVTPANARYWDRRYITSRRVLPETQDDGVRTPADSVEPADPDPLAVNPLISSEPDSVTPAEIEESPWNEFEGFLQGDFEAWLQSDEDAFEAYKNENG